MIIMAGVDHSTASISEREVFSFAKVGTVNVMTGIINNYEPSGCVVVSTCNRTEIYCSSAEEFDLPGALCEIVGVNPDKYRYMFTGRTERDALLHLCEVACGIRSRVFGEEQILTQVKESIELSRKEKAADSCLETAFRLAVTAAKKARTLAMPRTTKPSSAGRAVELAAEHFGSLQGKNALVIGSGEMGLLAAELLLRRGANVTITIRTYKAGMSRIPCGANSVPYDDRLESTSQADLVISATKSPHFTLTYDQTLQLENRPSIIIDLAMPRDIDPEIEKIPGVRCVNIDEIGWDDSDNIDLGPVYNVFDEHVERYYEWYYNKMKAQGAMKSSISQ